MQPKLNQEPLLTDKSHSAPDTDSLNYRDAGVDIDAGNRLVERIKPLVRATGRPETLGGLGGFGALFELPLERYRHPVLVSGTDGVGTKLRLAIDTGIHDTIGIDLVAMCVNDLLVQGAEPLFFLDYYATAKLDLDVAESVIKGICTGCREAGAALIGGETAEMPGMYTGADYDLAGFSVGIVEKDRLITGEAVRAGDRLIGLASSGPHSNGYSLIRRVIDRAGVRLDERFDHRSFGEVLLAPTKIYVKPVLALLEEFDIHAMAHITGGGLPENLPRVLPESTMAVIDSQAWQRPEIFDWLQQQGNIESAEMYRAFNCGIGFVLVADAAQTDAILQRLHALEQPACVIGEIVTTAGERHVQID